MNSFVCSNCNEETSIKDALIKKSFGENVWTYGLTCQHCKAYVHSHFETVEILKLKHLVKRARIAFQRSKTERAWKDYQHKKETLNLAHDLTQKKYAELLESA